VLTLAVLMQPSLKWMEQRERNSCFKVLALRAVGRRELGRSIQELNRLSLRPFLTPTDLHAYTLTFRQTLQSAAIERRGMDKHILSTAILRYETESLFRVVPFDCADTFLCRPSVRVSLRGGTRRRTPLSPARHLSSTCVHVDDFRDLRALLPLADPDFHASPLRHAATARHLKRSCVHERIGSACYGDKPETLLGIEPFDDCFDRL
jgi:hypothetical protein